MKISKKINRIIASSLSLAMVSSMTSVFPVFAETTESADFVYDNYSVSYNVTDSWGNTEKVSITLTNTSENPIENWMLYFDPNGEVTSMWDVTTAFTANNVPYFKNAGYNSTIAPNDSVTFNYFVDNCESIPDSYTLCQKRVEKSEGYDVDVVVDSSWGEGFNGTIIITNSTDKPIEDWELVFDTNFTITEITSSWSGTMTALEPYSYMLKGSYTSVIEPNSSVRLGFSGVKDGEPVITDTVLTEVVADEALVNFKAAYSDGVDLYAFGNYNNEDNAVDIEWYTNYINGDYEIWTSDDNSTYTSVAVVSDSTKYQYPITENFEKRYFKVSLDVGFDECIESVPFVVTKSETGYSVDFLDSDEDGLPDIFELQLGTNVNEPDSDGDDLTDYQEVYITGTDPTVYDSVTSGISDAEADSDDDRLSNAQEIELGTNPQLSDTDDDGLSDYDELNIYETDPLNPDSDGDGLQDGDEPHIGLDPTNPETFGTPDAEYKVAQTVQADSETLSFINTTENPYSLSINLNAVGYAENALSAEISSYTNVLSSNTAIVGNIVSLDYLYDEIEDVTLNFEMSSDYLDSMGETTVEGLELEGINRLYAFHYDEVNNILYPVETEISGNTVVVHASELGDYCLIDLNTWLEMLDISSAEDEEFTEPSVYSIESYAETEENIDTEKVFQDDVVIVDETVPSDYEEIIEEQINDVIENIKAEESIAEESETISTFSTDANTNNSRKKIDLVYVIDTSGSMSSAINAAKSSMSTLFNNLYNNGIDASVAVVTYSDYICDKENGAIIQPKNSKNKWAKDVPEAQALINNVSLYGCGHETPLDGLEKAHRDLEFHEDATKFMVLITDEPYIYSDNRYGIETMQDLANSLKDDTIYTSVVCYNSDASGYSPLYNTTNGIQINLASNWPVYLEEYIRTYIKELTSFKGFSMYNLTEITLDAAPEYGSNTNSDEDGFMDYEEIDWRFINKESDELILPTLNEYLIKTGKKNTFNMLPIRQRYRDKINSILILPILTDPTKTDTDGDDIPDDEDLHPLSTFLQPLLTKLQLIEQYVDEYLPIYTENWGFLQGEKPSNPTITINILRNLRYGDEKYTVNNDLDNLKNYVSGLMWNTTDGDNYSEFKDYINSKSPSLIKYFKNYQLIDRYDENVDFIHMLAALGAERYDGIIDPNLAGWAGDLQSFIYDLKLVTYGKDLNATQMKETAYNIMVNPYEYKEFEENGTNFSRSDLLADLDAKNIYCRYSELGHLSSMLKDYYTHRTNTRFTDFVSNMGGKEELHEIVTDYVIGTQIPKHLLLNLFAIKSLKEDDIQNIYNDSFIKNQFPNWAYYPLPGIHTLSFPSIVTYQESDALKYAFEQTIEAGLNEENN